jgi:hypothetical protein
VIGTVPAMCPSYKPRGWYENGGGSGFVIGISWREGIT